MAETGNKDSQSGDKKPSGKDKLEKEIQNCLAKAHDLEDKSKELRKQADELEDQDSKAAEDLKFKAREIDKKAVKLMKTAERLQSGWIQGGAMGTGIGAGIAGGVGMVAGTLITGVVAIPTAGLGMLLGAGTGLIHGPWIKFTDSLSKEESDEIVQEAEEDAERIANS